LWIPKLRSDGEQLHLKPPVVSAGLPAREHQHHLPTIPIIVASLVGGLEPWNFMTFHILEIIIPTDELIFFRGVETTNQPS